ncbi:hypothetical protein [Sodalis sp. RH22]|uniref:hypothetical protein n=1 Tax=unclassified Sodalis (in: enterobacteria) TaxID=2636512 RepID=UPI0039B38898
MSKLLTAAELETIRAISKHGKNNFDCNLLISQLVGHIEALTAELAHRDAQQGEVLATVRIYGRSLELKTDANKELPDGDYKIFAAPPAASLAPDGWKPIDTAPTDGTIVLLAGKQGRMADGYFGQPKGWANPDRWVWPFIHANPTHWKHLPAAPTKEDQ